MQEAAINIDDAPIKELVKLLSPEGQQRIIASMRRRIRKELIAEGKLEPKKATGKRALKQGKVWSRDDDAIVRVNYKNGMGAVEIAALIDRSVPGIIARVVRLELEEHRKKVRR